MSPTAPRLSVLIAAYNVAPWIEQCLHSLRQQSLTDLEILVVDDGSSDDTGALVEAIAQQDQRIHLYRQPNQGQSVARNRLLEQISSPYFTFVDADDYLTGDVLTQALALMEAQPELDFVEWGYEELLPDGTRIARCTEAVTLAPEAALTRLARMSAGSGMPWAKLYRRERLGGLRFPEGCIFEDLPFVIEAMLCSRRYAYLPIVGYSYRVARPGSSTEHWDGRLTQLFTNLLSLRQRLSPQASRIRALIDELYLRRLLIFALWADRHRSEQPLLLEQLLPFVEALGSVTLSPRPYAQRLSLGLFRSAPRLFLCLKRLLPSPL